MTQDKKRPTIQEEMEVVNAAMDSLRDTAQSTVRNTPHQAESVVWVLLELNRENAARTVGYAHLYYMAVDNIRKFADVAATKDPFLKSYYDKLLADFEDIEKTLQAGYMAKTLDELMAGLNNAAGSGRSATDSHAGGADAGQETVGG